MRSATKRPTDERTEGFRGRLPDLRTGAGARVVAVDGDRAEIGRLRSMGIRVGSQIEICQRRGSGVVIAVDGGRVAVAHTVAGRIVVEGGMR